LEAAPTYLARLFFCTAIAAAFIVMAPAPAGAAPPPVPQTYGAWSVGCEPRATNAEYPCVASQLVLAKNDVRQVVLGVMVAPTTDQVLPHIVFRFSAKASKEEGAAVKIDEQEAFRVTISQCDTLVCEVRSLLPPALLAQMRSGKMLQFAFFIKKQQLTYPVSLDGFDQAFTALQAAPKKHP